MTKKTLFVCVVASMLVNCTSHVDQLNKQEVISKLSVVDKAHLLIGTGMKGADGNNAVIGRTQSLVPGAAGTTYPIDSLGIPAIVLADGPAGLRIDPKREGDKAFYYCTHFPIGTLLASSWSPSVVEEVGKAIGEEVKEYGVDVLLAPGMNINRNPLCGRNFEYYSEDPVVAGKIAAAYVRGVQSNGVGTSIKHFFANNQETNRMNNDARISQRAIREIYLKGFEIAVKEAEPWTVMSSYNFVNGIYTSENRELLTNILRNEWGYKGLVVTDWYGGADGAKQIAAGNDLLQPGRKAQLDSIIAGIKSGKLSEKDLDTSVGRVLSLIEKTPRFNGYKYSNKPNLKNHAAIARKYAVEGMVLLKNDNDALPMSKNVKNVALYGSTSYNFIPGGTGSGNVNRAYTVSLVDGFKNGGYHVNPELIDIYSLHVKKEKKRLANYYSGNPFEKFLPVPLPSELSFTSEQLSEQAYKADIAVVTIGRLSGEFIDRKTSDFNISDSERQLLTQVCKVYHAAGKKVIVLLNIGGAIETASWKALPDAILCAWQAGQEGGNSVVDIMSGKAFPSGKLTMTWPNAYEDHASTANFPLNKMPDYNITNHGIVKSEKKDYDYTNYDEDIYVGYRYFDSFNKAVSFPFGYGLSYTTFNYSDAKIVKKDSIIEVSVIVKNSGSRKGKEIVELFVADPLSKQRNKAVKELKAFAKTKELNPGEEEVITMTIKTSDLASFNEKESAWEVTPGRYNFLVASSAQDIKAILTADVDAYKQKVSNVLQPNVKLNLLKR